MPGIVLGSARTAVIKVSSCPHGFMLYMSANVLGTVSLKKKIRRVSCDLFVVDSGWLLVIRVCQVFPSPPCQCLFSEYSGD